MKQTYSGYSINYSPILSKSLLVFALLSLATTFRGYAQRSFVDSVLNTYGTSRSYYFIKPIIGLMFDNTSLIGNEKFMHRYNSDRINKNFGLLIGYHSGKLEIETGLLNLPVSTGYRFRTTFPKGAIMTIGAGRKITYNYVPLTLRYTIWQPTRRWTMQGNVGVGYAWASGRIRFNSGDVLENFTNDLDGNRITIRSEFEKREEKSFLVGHAGLTLGYQLGNRFNAQLTANRLFSQKELVTIDARVLPSNETQPYRVHAGGSANGFNVSLGLQYQFGRRAQYRMK